MKIYKNMIIKWFNYIFSKKYSKNINNKNLDKYPNYSEEFDKLYNEAINLNDGII